MYLIFNCNFKELEGELTLSVADAHKICKFYANSKCVCPEPQSYSDSVLAALNSDLGSTFDSGATQGRSCANALF